MRRPMAFGADEPELSTACALAELSGKLVLVALLAGVCVLAPIAAAVLLSPWFGAALAVASFWVWSRLGPAPMPGFLPGIMCLWGHAAIFGALVNCVVLAVR